MISKKDITRIIKKIARKKRGLRDHQIIHPQREWFLGLFFTLLIVAGMATWSCLTYFNVTNRSIETDAEVLTNQTVYRTEIVDAALAEFRQRAENYDQLLENRIEIPIQNEIAESTEVEVEEVSDQGSLDEEVEAEAEEQPENVPGDADTDSEATPSLAL